MDQQESTSLNKFISSTGVCSRREADAMIEEGRVTLNGVVAVKGNRVAEGDEVLLDGQPLGAKPKAIYLAFNKPVGITCTTDSSDPDNIIDFIGYPQRLFPVGRLDKASQGLIFLTNDGDIVNKILRAGNAHEKEYIVTVNKPIVPNFIKHMSKGVPILGTMTQKCTVEQLAARKFRIILTEGMNRQIRRMCEFLGYGVAALKRVRIMNVQLDKLPIGEYRELSSKEMEQINRAVKDSVKTEEASLNKKLLRTGKGRKKKSVGKFKKPRK